MEIKKLLNINFHFSFKFQVFKKEDTKIIIYPLTMCMYLWWYSFLYYFLVYNIDSNWYFFGNGALWIFCMHGILCFGRSRGYAKMTIRSSFATCTKHPKLQYTAIYSSKASGGSVRSLTSRARLVVMTSRAWLGPRAHGSFEFVGRAKLWLVGSPLFYFILYKRKT